VRTFIRRFTRLSLGFSKKLANLPLQFLLEAGQDASHSSDGRKSHGSVPDIHGPDERASSDGRTRDLDMNEPREQERIGCLGMLVGASLTAIFMFFMWRLYRFR